MGRPGRFQIKAAIQSAHAQRRVSGRVEWPVVAVLYQLLMTFTPALGARIGHAIASFLTAPRTMAVDPIPAERPREPPRPHEVAGTPIPWWNS